MQQCPQANTLPFPVILTWQLPRTNIRMHRHTDIHALATRGAIPTKQERRGRIVPWGRVSTISQRTDHSDSAPSSYQRSNTPARSPISSDPHKQYAYNLSFRNIYLVRSAVVDRAHVRDTLSFGESRRTDARNGSFTAVGRDQANIRNQINIIYRSNGSGAHSRAMRPPLSLSDILILYVRYLSISPFYWVALAYHDPHCRKRSNHAPTESLQG